MPKEITHIDDFIDHGSRPSSEMEEYARWMFNHFRLSATCRMAFDQFMKDHKLFCMYEGAKYRVTGASRLGDVWLTEDYSQDTGYTKRVDVADCTEWSKD